ncbi:hypothetical protein E3E12_08115 [Formicincola oecophyllae]|uniref:Uncharacterized protein n=1 Tax=Formicincola oecophyllae TaxID=2558361 RepID=A0A4Y6UB37_9PROT|nr:hypothetical protein [Formicincola oecophyllae]QDH14160.1 hypothetical protein E3E12_08115 [Formicincola oecophyllae]
MRYYDLTIENDGPGASLASGASQMVRTLQPSATMPAVQQRRTAQARKPLLRYGSYVRRGLGEVTLGGPNDEFDPGALDIAFTLGSMDQAVSAATKVTLHGVGAETVQRAARLEGKFVTLRGGMGRGLPHSDPKTAGLLLRGVIITATGKAEGTAQYLELYINPILEPPASTAITARARKGTSLQGALAMGLGQAYGKVRGYKPPTFLVAKDVETTMDVTVTGRKISEFAKQMARACRNEGVAPWTLYNMPDGSFLVTDGAKAQPHPVRTIKPDVLLGRPTMAGPGQMNFTTALRADIALNDLVLLAGGGAAETVNQGTVLKAFTGNPQPCGRHSNALAGQWMVVGVEHVGHFRSTDGMQWASTFTCRRAPPSAH